MGDLEVAITEVRDLGNQLKTMHDDLKDRDGHVDYHTDQLAHSKVIDAMDNFKGNWDDHRDHLADKLDKLGDLAIQSAESFTKTDEDLASKIRQAMEEK
jgi:hypothetical protein